MIARFYRSGQWFPIGIGIGFALMILWNIFFVYTAIQTAPEVDAAYTRGERR